MLVLCLVPLILAGSIAYYFQLTYGLTVTGMGREVSWGLYISNFTFLVGIAASAVILVLPYYLYSYREFRSLALLGEIVAICAIVMCMLFILVDLGRVDRVLNIIRYPSYTSVMFYDFIVLSTYLLLNIGVVTFILKGRSEIAKLLAVVSIPWAISIHTVTAFIYSGLVARSFWNTAILAPKFLASAFASGASMMIILGMITKKYTGLKIENEALLKLAEIGVFAMVCNLFLAGVEIFTSMYSANPEHVTHYLYLFFGIENYGNLTSMWWISVILGLAAVILLIIPTTRRDKVFLAISSTFILVSVWMDKGLLLIVPAYVPSPTGLIEEYTPTILEILISAGIWALGILLMAFAIRSVSRYKFVLYQR
jgi:molybdopterin-containing oxidoreductase family membrane subunit